MDTLTTDRTLTAAEYYDLYRSLPRRAVIHGQPDSAAAVLATWERTHAELLGVPPTPAIHGMVRGTIRGAYTRRHLSGIDPPIAGTWRFTFALDGAEERTFYGRTRARPTSTWSIRPRNERTPPTIPPPPPEGYHLLVSAASSLEALPADCRPDRRIPPGAYMMLLDPPLPDGESRDAWVGHLELSLLSRQFPADSAIATFARGHFEHAYMERPDDAPFEPHGRFSRTPAGSIRLDQTTVLPDARTLVIRAERVSTRTIDC